MGKMLRTNMQCLGNKFFTLIGDLCLHMLLKMHTCLERVVQKSRGVLRLFH